MYAIRSYYAYRVPQKKFTLTAADFVAWAWLAGSRITSYNVCYTKLLRLIRGVTPGYPLVPAATAKRSFNDWTSHFNIAYKWTDELLTYASYSEGFKSGGFVQRVFPPKIEVPSFEPETAKVYEVGFKWWDANGRVTLNGAA